ncbi:MCM21 [[Candida] subhashii]|uniref:MCM21 n=1 Tax=[Candida] subhashii TaxID=561895 RepID=A0A8J5QGX0_9ASCO|nr:MCM21 [[Candida] subhashii]KAG7660848.1 MCM21 [[Candida] subhashii]
MDVNILANDIEDIETDINVIQSDINNLQSIKYELLNELQQLQQQQQQQQQTTTATNNTRNNDIPIDGNYYDIPELIKHSHFDSSISSYFESSTNVSSIIPQQQQQNTPINIIQQEIELRENILYENIFRMTGITAFPLNKHLQKEQLMGLRFDIYSTTTKTYSSPHYVILKKLNSFDYKLQIPKRNWIIYRDTLPKYIPLKEYSNLLDESTESIHLFVEQIRQFIHKTQYKHDKFDQLKSLTRNNFGLKLRSNLPMVHKINRDLQCQRIKLIIKHKSSILLEFELLCSIDLIETVKIISKNDQPQFQDHLRFCESIVKDTKINDLLKRFRLVFDVLIKEGIIE